MAINVIECKNCKSCSEWEPLLPTKHGSIFGCSSGAYKIIISLTIMKYGKTFSTDDRGRDVFFSNNHRLVNALESIGFSLNSTTSVKINGITEEVSYLRNITLQQIVDIYVPKSKIDMGIEKFILIEIP